MSATRTHRVRLYFIGDGGELLAISSRLLSPQTAKRLLRRIKPEVMAAVAESTSRQLPLPTASVQVPSFAGIYEILDAEMYLAKRPPPLQDGVRQVQRLDEFCHLTEQVMGGEQ